ncbi:MAG: hypothetical protein GC153_07150 [Alphaproteobacteria bacterium]|nr:hypothetical protein [Alphaproteobacteria bacterium]
MSYEDRTASRPEDDDSGAREGRFAALTAGLLARKGEAEPAMAAFSHARVDPASARQMEPGARHVVDKKTAGEEESPPVHVEPIDDARTVREEWQRIAPMRARKGDDAPRMEPKTAPEEGEAAFAENCPRKKIAASTKRAAVTFRMSVHDFLRLKLASAELETPSQDIIIEALDRFLDEKGVERLDNCRCLAETAKACGETEAAE